MTATAVPSQGIAPVVPPKAMEQGGAGCAPLSARLLRAFEKEAGGGGEKGRGFASLYSLGVARLLR